MDNNKFGVSSDDLVDEAPINQNFIISEKLAKADDKDPTQYIGDWHILGQAKNLSMDRPIAIKAAKKLNGKVFAVLGEWKKYLDLINLEAYNTGAHNIVEYVSQAIEVANEFLWMDVYAHIIEGLYLDTSEGAYASVGVDFQGALVDQVNERAVEYARTRGAELISIDGDPSIIESTRNMIGRTIADGLENNIGLSGPQTLNHQSLPYSLSTLRIARRKSSDSEMLSSTSARPPGASIIAAETSHDAMIAYCGLVELCIR